MAPPTVADVKSFLGLDPMDTFDDAWVDQSLKAAVDYVRDRLPGCNWDMPSPRQRLGLILLAGRFYERRGADGNDVNAGYEFGGPIPMIGREIQELLGLGRYFRPVVA